MPQPEASSLPPSDPLLRPTVAAKRLGVSIETLRRWMAKGHIVYEEIGPYRRKRIRQSQIDSQHASVPRATT